MFVGEPVKHLDDGTLLWSHHIEGLVDCLESSRLGSGTGSGVIEIARISRLKMDGTRLGGSVFQDSGVVTEVDGCANRQAVGIKGDCSPRLSGGFLGRVGQRSSEGDGVAHFDPHRFAVEAQCRGRRVDSYLYRIGGGTKIIGGITRIQGRHAQGASVKSVGGVRNGHRPAV